MEGGGFVLAKSRCGRRGSGWMLVGFFSYRALLQRREEDTYDMVRRVFLCLEKRGRTPHTRGADVTIPLQDPLHRFSINSHPFKPRFPFLFLPGTFFPAAIRGRWMEEKLQPHQTHFSSPTNSPLTSSPLDPNPTP